jgi:hypothetical protein
MAGAASCIFKMNYLGAEMVKEAQAAVDEVTETVFRVSRDVFTPVDTGDLKGSGVNELVSSGKVYRRRITYGRGLTYAFWVHEIPRNHFNPSTATWHYLKIPLDQMTPKFFSEIEFRVRQVLA